MQYLRVPMAEIRDFLDRFHRCEVTHGLGFFSVRREIAHSLASPPQHHSQVLLFPDHDCARTAEPAGNIMCAEIGGQ
jgi:hypothetical protein